MYFRQIEMSGFKSFADRTTVRLEQGITAIVGPNGCGKSNILDALRWSLGEQRAKELRGTHMLDIIFNGSETRPASGLAEVTVTFDNSESRLPVDFAEVQVTRRIYRSGESEYLINKVPCRLKDIHELFMDTGIGMSAYSLIGQGQMDLVLSSKPEDRRFLFEEAAGIVKYKARKRVAMRKLEGAEQNLLRLNDIIAEVQRQMRSLKRQVNAAIRYRELKESLQGLELRMVWVKYVRFQEQISQLREQFATAQDAYEKSMTESSRLEARNEELSLNRIEMERLLEARRGDVYEIEGEMEKIERQIALLRQQIDFLKEQQQQALREQEELKDRAAAIKAKAADTGEASQALRKEVEGCAAAIEAKQAAYDEAKARVDSAEARLEALRAKAVAAMNDRAKMETAIETLGVTIRNLDAQLQTIQDRRKSHDGRTEALATQLEAARGEETGKKDLSMRLASEREAAAKDQAEKAHELRDLHDKWQALRERKSSLEARLKSLQELRDSYEGFAAGVRAVMTAKQKNVPEMRGVIGPAGDLLSTDKTYERAIEAALGGNINNVVVEEADAAKSAIGFLNQHRAGRVTFLPLDTIRVGQNSDVAAVYGLKGVIGSAIEFVTFEPRLQKVMEYLFFNTIIVETLDDAIQIAKTRDRIPKLVTLNGEIVSSAGAVTGGQTQTQGRGLIGRSAEISELEDMVAKTGGEISNLASQAENLTGSMQELGRQVESLEKQERQLRHELGELGVAIARFTTELDNLQQSSHDLQAESESLELERAKLEEQRKEALVRAESVSEDDAVLQRESSEAQDSAAQARQALAVQGEELTSLRVRAAELTHKIEESERNFIREQSEYEETLRNAERRKEQAGQFKENEANLENEIATHIERAKELAESKEEAHAKVVEAQNSQHGIVVEIEGLTKTLRELHEQTRGQQSEVHRLELELRRSEDQMEFLSERVLTDYHVALASLAAEDVGTDEYDDETRESMVAELRQKIERMGQVNLMAIEEYEALEKRNEFLVSQEEDLRKAREALLNIVARIDSTIKDMFLQTFEMVCENFRVFFRRLFNGGQARVYLLDESDPLESGIEIEARPPGKKPQSISLLSGGEQAMTAIALLFGIFKAKPSPFCVLDEVDAPLDDANIGRFLGMVEEFKAESQFIIITHNKQSMARADVLHGVTMHERGVSKLVSVKMNEAPESAA